MRLRCTYCGGTTHTVVNCPKTWSGQSRRATMRCTYCGQRDHTVPACPKLGRPERVPDAYVLDK